MLTFNANHYVPAHHFLSVMTYDLSSFSLIVLTKVHYQPTIFTSSHLWATLRWGTDKYTLFWWITKCVERSQVIISFQPDLWNFLRKWVFSFLIIHYVLVDISLPFGQFVLSATWWILKYEPACINRKISFWGYHFTSTLLKILHID